MYVTLRSLTCFEQHAAHLQDKLYHHSLWYRHSSQTAIQYAGGERTAVQSALHLHTVRLLTEGDDTRGCGDTICPEDEQRAARNMLRSVV